ncbi:unnamed protein product [Heligmosomoides polygyrus]|uniref:RanBD1 domain-containing protein n=1 Tax=Heligmosomoides polygyrus TaxID=6339 RepID=A0A183FK53_HELPZ|nr:unnamed protein product [Heligmosomoides polygyrus]
MDEFEIIDGGDLADEYDVEVAKCISKKEVLGNYSDGETAKIEETVQVGIKEDSLNGEMAVEEGKTDYEKNDKVFTKTATAIASAMTKRLFEEAFNEMEKLEKEGMELVLPLAQSPSDTTTLESDTYEKLPEICIEFTSDIELSTPEQLSEDETAPVHLSDAEVEYVSAMVEESIQKVMEELRLATDEYPKEVEKEEAKHDEEEDRICTSEKQKGAPTPVEMEGIKHQVVPSEVPTAELLKGKDIDMDIPQDRVQFVKEELKGAQISTEIAVAQTEDQVVSLEFVRETANLSSEGLLTRARRCKLTVFLTFDQECNLLPTEDVNFHVEISQKFQAETTEVILSQIMYEDDGECSSLMRSLKEFLFTLTLIFLFLHLNLLRP